MRSSTHSSLPSSTDLDPTPLDDTDEVVIR